MTNYYSSGGAWFPVANKEDRLKVVEVLETLSWAKDQDFYFLAVDGGEELSESNKKAILTRTDDDKEIADCVISALQDDEYYSDLEYVEEGNSLFIYNAENINADSMANLVQGLLALLEYDNTVAISWADTIGKPIPYDNGGGAVVVSRIGSVWIETGFWTSMIAEKLFKQAGLEQNMLYPSLAKCPVCQSEDPMIENSHTEGSFHYSTVACDDCESEWVNIYAPISRQMLRTGEVSDD